MSEGVRHERAPGLESPRRQALANMKETEDSRQNTGCTLSPVSCLLPPVYFTGIIKCAYGVFGYMMYGTLVLVAVVG